MTISIGGKRLKVLWSSEMEDYGRYFHDAGTIVLRADLKNKPNEAMQTLRHEMLHAALAIGGVSFGMTSKLEEQVVRAADGLFFPAWDAFLKKQKQQKKKR